MDRWWPQHRWPQHRFHLRTPLYSLTLKRTRTERRKATCHLPRRNSGEMQSRRYFSLDNPPGTSNAASTTSTPTTSSLASSAVRHRHRMLDASYSRLVMVSDISSVLPTLFPVFLCVCVCVCVCVCLLLPTPLQPIEASAAPESAEQDKEEEKHNKYCHFCQHVKLRASSMLPCENKGCARRFCEHCLQTQVRRFALSLPNKLHACISLACPCVLTTNVWL